MPEQKHVVKGYLQLKKKAAIKDSWHTFLCEFDPKSRQLTVKSKEGNFVFWQKVIERAWPMEPRASRRQNRFDVMSVDGVTAAFAAPKESDMKAWLNALEKTAEDEEPVPVPEVDDLTQDEAKWAADALGGEGGSEAVFEIAGDEADDQTLETGSVVSAADTDAAAGSAAAGPADETDGAEGENPGGFLGIGHVVRWLAAGTNNEELLPEPVAVSEAEVAAEAERVDADLIEDAEAEAEGSDGTQREYKDLSDLLTSHQLGQFALGLHTHGVDTLAELKGCTDAWLGASLGMKPAHVVKFRRALQDAKLADHAEKKYSVYEAPDGFRGTYDEVAAHESKLGFAAKPSGGGGDPSDPTVLHLYEAPDGFRGTFDEVLAYEKKMNFVGGKATAVTAKSQALADDGEAVLFKLYEAPDGFRGSHAEVLAYEERMGFDLANPGQRPRAVGAEGGGGGGDPNDPTVIHLYEAPDGFRGTYDEVAAHEAKLRAGGGGSPVGGPDDPSDPLIIKLYEAPDGFRGTYDEVQAYEATMHFDKGAAASSGSGGSASDPNDPTLLKLYEAPDGFRGTYDEVAAHEAKMDFPASGLSTDRNEAHDTGPVILRLYECSDGFRGTYEECKRHEVEHNLGGGDDGPGPR